MFRSSVLIILEMASLDTLFLYSDVDEGEGSIMKKVTNGDIGERGAKI